MKLSLILACLALCLLHTQATNCRGRPLKPSCHGVRDRGYSNKTRCHGNSNNRMWYYDEGKKGCRFLYFKGCGGNNNRFCEKADCDANCVV